MFLWVSSPSPTLRALSPFFPLTLVLATLIGVLAHPRVTLGPPTKDSVHQSMAFSRFPLPFPFPSWKTPDSCPPPPLPPSGPNLIWLWVGDPCLYVSTANSSLCTSFPPPSEIPFALSSRCLALRNPKPPQDDCNFAAQKELPFLPSPQKPQQHGPFGFPLPCLLSCRFLFGIRLASEEPPLILPPPNLFPPPLEVKSTTLTHTPFPS